MRSCPSSYFIVVIEDTSVGEVIGSATLAVEQKFIRECKCVGIFGFITSNIWTEMYV